MIVSRSALLRLMGVCLLIAAAARAAAVPEESASPGGPPRLGDIAPDFTADTTKGRIRFHEWLDGKWAILFSHPADFTPVCTTELGQMAVMTPEFDRRGVKVIALSVDTLERHRAWARDIADVKGAAPGYPLIADTDRAVARLYGMIHPNASDTATVRSVFVIGPDRRIKLTLTYPASTGRNFAEILRVVDALQLTASHAVATPADWTPGDDVIIAPSVPDEEARKRFPGGWTTVKPYLRVVPSPRKP
jgi:alkyl hydroperoxide reductase subunit AhpC